MDVSENSGTPKSSILIGFSIINHPFWDTTMFPNTHRRMIHRFILVPTYLQCYVINLLHTTVIVGKFAEGFPRQFT